MNQPSGNDVLMSSGKAPKAAEWLSDGWVVEGEVVGIPKSYHAREYDRDNPGGGKLKFFSSGDPVLGISVDLKTSMRDLGNADDTGMRRIYADKTRQLTAIRDAVRAVGAEGIEAGGFLSVMRVGTEEGQGSIPATTWAAKYAKPGQWRRPTPVPAGPPEWAQQPQVPSSPPATQGPGGWQGQQLTQPQGAPQTPVDVWSGQLTQQTFAGPTQTTLGGMPAMAQQQAVQAAQAATNVGPSKPTITASAAAALANGGVDISAFNIVPG